MMEQKWGRIINIASTAASVGAETSGVYCASPTWVQTSFGMDWMKKCGENEGMKGEKYIEDVKSGNPQGRLVQPAEVGELAAFLCSDGAMGIAGQDLSITAGALW